MHRFALDIDPVAYIRNLLDKQNPDPVQSVVLAELGGAESIVCYLRDDLKTVNVRDVTLFRQIVKTYLNVRSNLTEENLRNLMRIKPDMVTFVAPGDVSSVEAHSFDLELHSTQLQDYIAQLRASNILSSVLIQPEIRQVKDAGKLEFDYVEFNVSSMQQVEDMSSEMDFLEEVAAVTLAANKLGMGVNVSGSIGYENIRELAQIENIEDIIVGRPVLNRALAIGYEQAVRDINALI